MFLQFAVRDCTALSEAYVNNIYMEDLATVFFPNIFFLRHEEVKIRNVFIPYIHFIAKKYWNIPFLKTRLM